MKESKNGKIYKNLLSVWSGFQHEVGVPSIFGLKLLEPLIQEIGRDDQVLALDSVDEESAFVVAHHVVVEILGHQFCVFFLSIRGHHQVFDLVESLGSQTQFHRRQSRYLRSQWEPCWEDVWGSRIGDSTQILQLCVRRLWVVKCQSHVARHFTSQSQANIRHCVRIHNVCVVNSVVALEVCDWSLSR